MLDYLTSKMVWIIAAVVLTASVMGVFNWQKNAAEEVALDDRADSIAGLINTFCSTSGDIKAMVSFNESADPNFYFEPTVNGEPYTLNFSRNGFTLIQGDTAVRKNFVSGTYLLDPYFLDDEAVLNNGTLQRYHLSVGDTFFIESKRISGTYHVFIYPETPEDVLGYADHLGGIIQDSLKWEFDRFLNVSSINTTTEVKIQHEVMFYRSVFFVGDEYQMPYPITPLYLCRPYRFEYTYPELINVSENHISMQRNESVVLERRLISLEGEHNIAYFLYMKDVTTP